MNRNRTDNSSLVVGVDFDNTIATYDELLHRQSQERGLISKDVAKTKLEVRNTIRRLPEGEIQWQKLQGLVYGPMMKEAATCEGVESFLQRCQQHRVKIFIVSHKTEFANYDVTRTNLRKAALDWMVEKHFFDTTSFGLSQNDVFFEPTRRQKVQRITDLGCTHFIDDLPEVFDDNSFPANVNKILYSPGSVGQTPPGVTIAGGWENISKYLLGSNDFDSSLSVGLSLGDSKH